LQQRYVRLVNGGAHGDAAALFVDAARAVVDVSVRHVTPTGDAGDTITFGADGTATASLHCAVKTATPIEGDGTLVEMARLQGDGILQGTELRVLESTFVKRADGWKIDRLAYRSA
jgi:hypothetical protein